MLYGIRKQDIKEYLEKVAFKLVLDRQFEMVLSFEDQSRKSDF